MTDYTAAVEELSQAYQANRMAKKMIREEVKQKYKVVIDKEIQERQLGNDVEFANHLARVKERTGMPLGVIQDHVIRTRSWKIWEYWRGLAGIDPERIIVRDAKRARVQDAKPYRIEGGVVTVLKDKDGGDIKPFRVESIFAKPNGGLFFWPYMGCAPGEDGYEDQMNFKASFEDLNEMSDFLEEQFEKFGDDVSTVKVSD